MMKFAVLATLLVATVIATPDCYDGTVAKRDKSYMELLPKMMFYGQTDWLMLDAGANCAYYTYRDTLFKSYSPSVTGIYFVFYKGNNYQCNLDNQLLNLNSGEWLYANTFFADPSVCGYYVGVANGGATPGLFQVIRTSAEALRITLTVAAMAAATYMLN